MTSQSKRRIQVASFSFGDVARGHVAGFALGVALILGAAVGGWAAATNARAAAESKDAARMLMVVADDVTAGSQDFAAGGSSRLARALAARNMLAGALADMRAAAGWPAAPSLRMSANAALAATNNMLGPLGEMDGAIRMSAQLSEEVSQKATNFAALAKAIRASGKAETSLARSAEAVARLYSYAEAGFGVASTPRVDYDLRVLSSELSSQGELRASGQFITPLLGIAQAAVGKSVTAEQLTRALNAATAAKAAGEQLGNVASRSDAAWMLGAAAAAMLLAGLAVLGFTLARVLDDFGRRYHRGVQQFRAGEAARQTLTQDLRAAVESGASAMSVTEVGGELAEISRLINTIAQQQAGDVNALVQAAENGLQHEASASSLLSQAEEQARAVAQSLQDVAARVAQAGETARLVALDAAAASMAADEAVMRSADANQVAQDAASRMEALREGLQETAKGVKRLGERTQEIDAVVDTMELVSEQIGVLALNASLEAERAGEAGAGFRAVAKEVQLLAHRSEDALRQISGLVQGAQADARAAGALLERSTNHAVAGSNVAAVSHALLGALPALAADVEAMTHTMAQAGQEGQGKLEQAHELLGAAAAAAGASADKAKQVRAPLARLRHDLQLSNVEA